MSVRLTGPIEWNIVVAPTTLMIVVGGAFVGRTPTGKKEVAAIGAERCGTTKVFFEAWIWNEILRFSADYTEYEEYS
jgi:hypothetical protein